jgi:hypothetical protein
MAGRQDVQLADLISGSVLLQREDKGEWTAAQRNYGPEHDNNQNPTWLRIRNPGPPAKLRVRIRWAQSGWMELRKCGYLKQGEGYKVVRGTTTPTETLYDFTAPRGESVFGAFPWYSNEDGDRFLKQACRLSPMCRVRSIGKSGEGRDILCLSIGKQAGRKKKRNIVVVGREHATEASGSSAVQGTANFLLSRRAPQSLFDRYVFHLIPIANPDGTAHGLKLTRPGPLKMYDVLQGAFTSPDPTIRALREETMALRPACYISHHCYLFPTPWIGVFDKRLCLKLLEGLIPGGHGGDTNWCLRVSGPEPGWLRWRCHDELGSTVVLTELPWAGRLPGDIERQGEEVLKATLAARETQKTKQEA